MRKTALDGWETIAFKEKEKRIALIGKGRYAYLWVRDERKNIVCFSGRKSLRSLAKHILKVIPDEYQAKVR